MDVTQSPRTTQRNEDLGFFGSLITHGWTPTNSSLLAETEKAMLEGLKTPYRQFFVNVGENQINTIALGSGPPLVMIHGYGGGVGLWVGNLDEFARHHTVYAIDLLGFGRSSRPIFKGDTHVEAQKFFLDSIEEWRKQLNLTQFCLFGHSLGAYLSCIYAFHYPEHVSHLMLVDPWGVPQKPIEDPLMKNATLARRMIFSASSIISSPFSLLKAAGPVGPKLIQWARPDLVQKFQHLVRDKSVCSSYFYHCNAQDASGDIAFSNLKIPFSWAVDPLEFYLPKLPRDLRVSMIYGKNTWMDINAAILIAPAMRCFVEMVLIPDVCSTLFRLTSVRPVITCT